MKRADHAHFIRTVKILLTNALISTYDASKVAGLLFSGGLDSGILAAMMSKIHTQNFRLFVAGTESAKDIKAAGAVAASLNLPLVMRQFTLDDVRQVLFDILSIVTVVDVLQVELAIPLYLAAKCAHQFDVTVLFSGQGADELFGGYARYEQLLVQSGEAAVIEEMRQDLQKLREGTLPNQRAVVHHFGLDLVTPFLDNSIIQFALTLPLNLKLVPLASKVRRKHILRLLAQDLALPPEVVNAPKCAMQYGSGIHGILGKLSHEYWLTKHPSISLRESRSYDRIHHFLNQVKREGYAL